MLWRRRTGFSFYVSLLCRFAIGSVLEDVVGHESLFACAKQLRRSPNNQQSHRAFGNFLDCENSPAAKLSNRPLRCRSLSE
jgi:hypothetical protein